MKMHRYISPVQGKTTKYTFNKKEEDIYGRKIHPINMVTIEQEKNIVKLEKSLIEILYREFKKREATEKLRKIIDEIFTTE